MVEMGSGCVIGLIHGVCVFISRKLSGILSMADKDHHHISDRPVFDFSVFHKCFHQQV